MRMTFVCLVVGVILGMFVEPVVQAESIQVAPHERMMWRELGPWRGGRTTTVAGIPGDRATFYLGATGGGVWRTDDAGNNWRNISDRALGTGSIGAITISPGDPQRIYVGTGESPYRLYSSSYGDGVYRSDDGGATWRHLGLADVRQIGGIAVSPIDPDYLLVAAQGDPWAPNEQRGIYLSTDGGANWERTLFVNPTTGARHVHFDPTNAAVAYAATWDHDYDPWYLRSGGAGSGIFKSTDGGQSWIQLRKGLPPSMGKIGIAVSPVDPRRLWAVVEADPDTAGLYLSDDAGVTWRHINRDRRLHTRAWYYIHVWADPHDIDTVYVLANPPTISNDGGVTFEEWDAHGWDFHALWLDPASRGTMIVGSDGGATVTLDGGGSWSSLATQATAQLYRVWADDRNPYFIYSAQQDNTTLAITSDRLADGYDSAAFKAMGGNETGFLATHPTETRYVYASGELGILTEFDRSTGATRHISASLRFPEGTYPRDLSLRYAVNSPVLVSWDDAATIYHAAQKVMRTPDRGRSWEAVSPDLTRNDAARQGAGGGPFSGELINHYGAISYLAQSPLDANILWAGSNDGFVHVTRDGVTWSNVTPPGLEEGLIDTIDASPHKAGRATVTVNRMRFGDYAAYLYRTENFGRTWRRIDSDLPESALLRSIREDPGRRGLLFAGSERGLFISYNDGASWQPAASNLPHTPVTGIIVRGADVVVSTQGRGLWVLDDIAPLREYTGMLPERAGLIKPSPAILRFSSTRPDRAVNEVLGRGDRRPGVAIDVNLPAEFGAHAQLEVLSESGTVLRRLNLSHMGEAPSTGLNRVFWDLRQEPMTVIEDAFDGTIQGARVGPGTYRVRLQAGAATSEAPLTVVVDPRIEATAEDFRERDALLNGLRELLQRVSGAVLLAREVDRSQLVQSLRAWESKIHPPQLEISQDRVNYGGKFLFDLAVFATAIDGTAPPYGRNYQRRLEELRADWRALESELNGLLGSER